MFIYDALFDTQESAALLRAAGAARHRPARGDQVDRRDVLLPDEGGVPRARQGGDSIDKCLA